MANIIFYFSGLLWQLTADYRAVCRKTGFSKPQYVFAVITAGAIHGGSFDSLGD